NWPVLWIYACAAAVLVHDATGLPFSTLVKLPPIGADACIAVLLFWTALRQSVPNRAAALMGLAYALNPVSILITGYHGQFDALMLAPTVLAWSIWTAPLRPHTPNPHPQASPCLSRADLVASGLALGIGVWFKPVPLVLLPVMLPRLR